jgi:ribonuclease HI
MKNTETNIIQVFTDGSCINNPGAGGYAICIVYPNGKEITFAASEQFTTNNRMELKAVILGLEKTLDTDVNSQIFSDSSYVVNGINKWITGWIKNGWKNSQKKEVLNADLWKELYSLQSKNKNTEIIWIKGHSGNKYNNIAHNLAIKEARKIDKLDKE